MIFAVGQLIPARQCGFWQFKIKERSNTIVPKVLRSPVLQCHPQGVWKSWLRLSSQEWGLTVHSEAPSSKCYIMMYGLCKNLLSVSRDRYTLSLAGRQTSHDRSEPTPHRRRTLYNGHQRLVRQYTTEISFANNLRRDFLPDLGRIVPPKPDRQHDTQFKGSATRKPKTRMLRILGEPIFLSTS